MKKSSIKIGFTGDIAFDEYTTDYYNNPKKIDKSLLDFLNKNDYNVVDLESPITSYDKTLKKSLAHKMEECHLQYVKKIIKNPIAVIGNNHMMDFGIQGLKDTLKNLKKNNVEYIGAGKDLEEASKYIILGDEVKVGVISIQYKDYFIASETEPGTFHDSRLSLLKKRIKELKDKTDWIVVVYHGGEEFLSVPMPYTKRLFKKILGFGCDIIVAHHPHVVQGYDVNSKNAIFYSLGNFIFDTEFQRIQSGTDEGVLLSIEFNKDSFEFDSKLLKINRDKLVINEYDGKTKFKQINPKKYPKMWKSEALKIKTVSNNKKYLRKIRMGLKLGLDGNKMVSFSEIEKDIKDKKYTSKLQVQENKFGSKYINKARVICTLLKNCIKNKKYRCYAYARILKIFR